ncbi:MAG: hypothetical protein WAW87_02845 [Candidatus Ferrigenium altingense]
MTAWLFMPRGERHDLNLLVMPDGQPGDDFLCRIANALHDEFDIDHTTIRVETGEHPCVLSGHAAH